MPTDLPKRQEDPETSRLPDAILAITFSVLAGAAILLDIKNFEHFNNDPNGGFLNIAEMISVFAALYFGIRVIRRK